jgi:hypothetical protein
MEPKPVTDPTLGDVLAALTEREPPVSRRVRLHARSAAAEAGVWRRPGAIRELLWNELRDHVWPHVSVGGEWSFAQTLRHLVLATDAWFGRSILEIEQPFHPIGQAVLSCLHLIFEEEWEHHRYAVRDLGAIEAKSDA